MNSTEYDSYPFSEFIILFFHSTIELKKLKEFKSLPSIEIHVATYID